MNITAGTVVISRAGHDCGRAMLVVRTDGEFLFVADGKERKLEKPKKKNRKHVRATSRVIEPAGLTDRSLRRTLRELFEQDSALQESE
ncbi:MAG: KOW domain-containing RNA-binding protein [Oscillospiraceae bacterium]|nr:KOW domain-containing RNA-binding protein [Oscillospiraceae bacterium]